MDSKKSEEEKIRENIDVPTEFNKIMMDFLILEFILQM